VAKSPSGDVLHCTAVRYRLNGSGDLQTYLRSYDNVESVQLADISMATITNKEPTILANFQQQAIQLEFKTTEIDEVFTISKIVVYVKPVATGFPTS
jgi:hypothetical protein